MPAKPTSSPVSAVSPQGFDPGVVGLCPGLELRYIQRMDGDLAAILRPELAELRAYAPVDAPPGAIRLDANEAPPYSSAVLREVVARAVAAVPLERYPDARARALKERIAERTGAKPEDLLVGSGSDEV